MRIQGTPPPPSKVAVGASSLGKRGHDIMVSPRSRGTPLSMLNPFFQAVQQFRLRNPAITGTNIAVFIRIAQGENVGITQRELYEEFHVSDATMSRMVRALTKEGDGRSPGLGLVELTFDPNDTRRKLLVLTPQGRILRDALLATAEQMRGNYNRVDTREH